MPTAELLGKHDHDDCNRGRSVIWVTEDLDNGESILFCLSRRRELAIAVRQERLLFVWTRISA